MTYSIRLAEFAGRFYPKSKSEIEKLLEKILSLEIGNIKTTLSEKNLLGGIVPHAGYIFSAYQAVHVYEILKRSDTQFETFVIVNPNHTGIGSKQVNVSSSTYWETPMGSIPVDLEFVQSLNIEKNNSAHMSEHSGEVQLPMLSYFIPYKFKIVIITMNVQTSEVAIKLSKSIRNAVEKTKRKIFLMASSDFSHYETPELGFEKDQLIIDEILKLNTSEIYNKVKEHSITACGYGPIMTLVEYLKKNSKSPQIELLKRGHSGEIQSSKTVVDYASFLGIE